MSEPIPIPSVIEVISKCWIQSEAALRSSIHKKHHDLDEVLITRLFYDELRESLNKASESKEVENAFLRDLRRSFPEFAYSGELRGLSSGIIASVSLHPPELERATGGDLGLLLARPDVSESRYRYSALHVGRYRRGLLCQAKVKRRSGKWGTISKNQEKVLANHLGYLSLLLYEYADPERLNLMPFRWQLCKDYSALNIKQWLRASSFPGLLVSERVIDLLGRNKIGTASDAKIEKFLCPETRPFLEFRITWPDKPSDFEVPILRKVSAKEKQYVFLKQ